MNARARREAMKRMDSGDFAGAKQMIVFAVSATQVACAPMAASPEVMQELSMLQSLSDSLSDPGDQKMTRKKLSYQSYQRGQSKPLR